MIPRALLLAGGLGTRLKPLTDTLPKCLVPVAGRPILEYWYDALESAGVGQALLNTHHFADQVRNHIAQTNATRTLQISEAYEPELLGSAGTVAANRDWADGADEIIIIYADNLSDIDLSALLATHRDHDDPMTMALFHTEFPSQCGIATLDANNVITKFIEKPENPESDLANAGIYVIDAQTWREIADMKAFDFGFDVLPNFVGRMRGFEHNGYHRDIGNPDALARASADAPGLFR